METSKEPSISNSKKLLQSVNEMASDDTNISGGIACLIIGGVSPRMKSTA